MSSLWPEHSLARYFFSISSILHHLFNNTRPNPSSSSPTKPSIKPSLPQKTNSPPSKSASSKAATPPTTSHAPQTLSTPPHHIHLHLFSRPHGPFPQPTHHLRHPNPNPPRPPPHQSHIHIPPDPSHPLSSQAYYYRSIRPVFRRRVYSFWQCDWGLRIKNKKGVRDRFWIWASCFQHARGCWCQQRRQYSSWHWGGLWKLG